MTLGSILYMSKCFQANISRLSLRKVEIASLSSSNKIFLSLSTFVGSLSSTGRSTRSFMGPVVASSFHDLGSIMSSRGPSLGGC